MLHSSTLMPTADSKPSYLGERFCQLSCFIVPASSLHKHASDVRPSIINMLLRNSLHSWHAGKVEDDGVDRNFAAPSIVLLDACRADIPWGVGGARRRMADKEIW
jgi:hypothetical protein